MLTETATTVSY